MKSKLKFIIPLLVVVLAGGVYKFVLSKPEPAPKTKVHGTVYVLPKEFLVNLQEGRFARVSIGLLMAPAATGSGASAATAPPEGYGAEPQEALIRSIVTDTLSGHEARLLTASDGRKQLKLKIERRLLAETDIHVEDVLLPDVVVQ